jgi:hypothetical protein
LDAKAHYSLITHETRRRLRLTPHQVVVPRRPDQPSGNIFYCAYVPIDLGNGPVLPGLFLAIDHIQGGYEILMGKPWLVGIERLHGKGRYHSPSHPTDGSKRQYHLEITPDTFSYSSDNSTWKRLHRQHRDNIAETNITRPRKLQKRKRSMEEMSQSTPSLGGSFTKAL